MKKTIAAVINLILIFSVLTGCGSSKETQSELKNLKIGIALYDQYDTFVDEMMEAVADYAKELEEKYDITVTLDVQNAGGNQMTQNDQMDYFIDRECDIVCINLVDRTDASTIIERGKSANIPIIFFNRELVEEDLERWDKLYYVGTDAFESGMFQGELLVEKLEEDFAEVDHNGDGVLQYVMLEGQAGHQDAIVRTMYTINTVTEAGYKVEKLADGIANWNRDQGKTKMVQWLQEYGTQIEVVFSNNDAMALGAVDALKEQGYYKNTGLTPPVVLGIDGVRDGLKAVEEGYFLGTVINDSAGQAKAMLELAYSIASGNELCPEITLLDGKYVRLPYQKVSKNDLNQ